jgi:hypothetical protein
VAPPATSTIAGGADSFLWPQNRIAWDVCLDMLSQIEVAGMGGIVGFKYGREFDRVMRVNGVGEEDEDDVFRKMQAFERWWVAHINERMREASKKK